jgi:hypothetical protein
MDASSRASPPTIAAFCSYVGTAGCFLGTTGRLAATLSALHRVVVEPAESAVLSGGVPGTHHIEGGGIGSWPPLLRPRGFRRGRDRSRDRCVRHGPPGRPNRGHPFGSIDRRKSRRRSPDCPAGSAPAHRCHRSGRQRPEVPQRTASAGLQAAIELGCEGRDIWQREAIHRSDRDGPTETAGPEGAT